MNLSKEQLNAYWYFIGQEIIPSFRITALVSFVLIFISGPLPDILKDIEIPVFITALKYFSILYCLMAIALSYVKPNIVQENFQWLYFVAIIFIMLPNAIHSGLEGGSKNHTLINLIHVEVAFALFLPSSKKFGLGTLLCINLIYFFCNLLLPKEIDPDNTMVFSIINQVTILIICLYGHNSITNRRYKNHIKNIVIEEKNNELLQKNLRLKINPHFIFNSLNSIANLTYANKSQEAHKNIIKFASLLRLSLEKSDNLQHSIEEEKTFLKAYLDLQHDMLTNFNYTFEIDPQLDEEDISIPAFIIQPFVENALIHAYTNKEEKRLHIRIKQNTNSDLLNIEIEDNGVGRAVAAHNKKAEHQSLGMSITETRIKALHKKDDIQIEIIDLKDDKGAARGTKIILTTPYQHLF